MLSTSKPLIFRGMDKLFAILAMEVIVVHLWVSGRNAGGTGAPAVGRRSLAIFPNSNLPYVR